ncbi:hypothetical protein JF540_22810 [Salipiger thiooxidans]|uniref:hypothetical protein n=1 Tax=Salipiger thiooxidans TaxID=282683 RepID=UPI001A8C436A|nr:hypothetical protein [Salipiger thiooxidans]MBN8189521.1 hypothetical protein [Salipiger thiooxidans]
MAAPILNASCPVKSTGQRPAEKRRDLFGLKAKWLRFADERQLRRLAKLHVRIERRKALIADDHAERLRIQDCCVKRMQRERMH